MTDERDNLMAGAKLFDVSNLQARAKQRRAMRFNRSPAGSDKDYYAKRLSAIRDIQYICRAFVHEYVEYIRLPIPQFESVLILTGQHNAYSFNESMKRIGELCATVGVPKKETDHIIDLIVIHQSCTLDDVVFKPMWADTVGFRLKTQQDYTIDVSSYESALALLAKRDPAEVFLFGYLIGTDMLRLVVEKRVQGERLFRLSPAFIAKPLFNGLHEQIEDLAVGLRALQEVDSLKPYTYSQIRTKAYELLNEEDTGEDE